jgi:hypothetical protein
VVATKEMTKQKTADAAAGADTPGEPVTTVKCFERVKRKVNQIGALLNLSQPEVFALYEPMMDETLLRELAKRQQELRQSKRG